MLEIRGFRVYKHYGYLTLLQAREAGLPTNNVRVPAIAVTANGEPVGEVLEVGIESNSFLGANRFRVTTTFNAVSYASWIPNDINVVINVGLDGNWQELIRGPVDRIEVDVGAGVIHIDGRDLTSRLIEARTQETFENQTASDVAVLIATRRGLVPNVSTTTALIGRNYGGDYSRITLDQYSTMTTEWDLLTRLASSEGFDVWVDGQTLNFVPPQDDPSPIFVRPVDCQSLRLDRAVALSAGLNVTVKSWDCRAHAAVSQGASLGSSDGGQSYVIVKPNLSEFEAAALAHRVLSEMSQNTRLITIEWPGELSIKPRQSLTLIDSATDFDGPYVVTSVERTLSFQRGFTEILQARTPPWMISSIS